MEIQKPRVIRKPESVGTVTGTVESAPEAPTIPFASSQVGHSPIVSLAQANVAANAIPVIRNASVSLSLSAGAIISVKLNGVSAIKSYMIQANDDLGGIASSLRDGVTIVIENMRDILREISIVYTYLP